MQASGILVGDLGAGLETLLTNVKKLLPNDRQLTINVFEVEKVDLDASLLADLVAEQLEKRIAFRRAMKKTIEESQRFGAEGIKVMIAGRLNGAEIARNADIAEVVLGGGCRRFDVAVVEQAHGVAEFMGKRHGAPAVGVHRAEAIGGRRHRVVDPGNAAIGRGRAVDVQGHEIGGKRVAQRPDRRKIGCAARGDVIDRLHRIGGCNGRVGAPHGCD